MWTRFVCCILIFLTHASWYKVGDFPKGKTKTKTAVVENKKKTKNLLKILVTKTKNLVERRIRKTKRILWHRSIGMSIGRLWKSCLTCMDSIWQKGQAIQPGVLFKELKIRAFPFENLQKCDQPTWPPNGFVP